MYVLKKGLQVAVRHVLHDESDRITDGARADQSDDVGVVVDLLHQVDLT